MEYYEIIYEIYIWKKWRKKFLKSDFFLFGDYLNIIPIIEDIQITDFFCAIDISDYEIQIPLNVRFILWFVYVYIFHSQQTIYLISVKNIFKHI